MAKPRSTSPAATSPAVEADTAPQGDTSTPDTSTPETSSPLAVSQRITIGGRGAKKDASGAIVTPAEPTVTVFKGEVDLSPLTFPANAEAVRNIAAAYVLDEVAKALRAARREEFEAVCGATEGDTEAKGEAATAALTVATPEEVAAAIAKVLAEAPNPFAPKAKGERSPGAVATLKASNAAKDAKMQWLQAHGVKVFAAMDAGDMDEVQALRAVGMAAASAPETAFLPGGEYGPEAEA